MSCVDHPHRALDTCPYCELTTLRARCERYRKAFEHAHVTKRVSGKFVDECDKCGLDLRDEMHARNAGVDDGEGE